jgi:antirestriction protein ArdC
MVAYDIYDGCAGSAGIVQIGEPVRQARATMQQRDRRFLRHAGVAVRAGGHHAFEQTQNATHTGNPVQRRDKVQFARSRICETGVYAALQEGMDQTFSTVQ